MNPEESDSKKTWARTLPKKKSKSKHLTRRKVCNSGKKQENNDSGTAGLPSTEDAGEATVPNAQVLQGESFPEPCSSGLLADYSDNITSSRNLTEEGADKQEKEGEDENNVHFEEAATPSTSEMPATSEGILSNTTQPILQGKALPPVPVYIGEAAVQVILEEDPPTVTADFTEDSLPQNQGPNECFSWNATSEPASLNITAPPVITESQGSSFSSAPGVSALIMPSPERTEASFENFDASRRFVSILDRVAAPSISSPAAVQGAFTIVEIGAPVNDREGNPHAGGETVMFPSPSPDVPASPLYRPSLLEEVRSRVQASIPKYWVLVEDSAGAGASLGLRAVHKTLIIQRSIFFGINGEMEITVHGKELTPSHPFWSTVSGVELTPDTFEDFIANILQVWNRFRGLEVCKGIEDFEPFWNFAKECEVDHNLFRETRYDKTCRAKTCELLVKGLSIKRCKECQSWWRMLYSRHKAAQNRPTSTPPKRKGDKYLNTPEKKKRLVNQRKEIKSNQEEIARLRRQIDSLLEKDSVDVDDGLDDDLRVILSEEMKNKNEENANKLTDLQRLFIEQQLKAASCKKSSSMRWHPAIIRLALSLKMTSTAAYEVLSGCLRLPSERQLFDYSHAIDGKDDIHPDIVGDLAERLDSINPNPFQRQFVLLHDELFLKKNLVYRKTTGDMVGYVKLGEVRAEILALEKIMEDESLNFKTPKHVDPPIVSKMLSYMAVGVCNGIEGVVANYGVDSLTSDQLDHFTWDVIGALEANGMEVIAIVCDGAGPNHAFYQAQKSMYPTHSGTVFCTPNRYDPDRPVFLMSDPPHLLKTTRNCLFNSGRKNKKGKYVRYMVKNNQPILWDTVVRLYNLEKHNTVRCLYKLTQAAVELNSYSVMNVSLAARVLSRSVASMVRQQQWSECEEFAIFVQQMNDLFDMLNGSYGIEHQRTRNDLLAPYKRTDDFRFKELMDSWYYLEGWLKEVRGSGKPPAEQSRMLLSSPTLQGWERTIKGFNGAVSYILRLAEESGDQDRVHVMARKFCQDPLEHGFGRHRTRLGGNTHPDFDQALHTNVQMHQIKKLGVLGPKRGNSGKARRSALSLKDLEGPLKKRTPKARRTL